MLFNSIQSIAKEIKNGNIFPWLNKKSKRIKGIIISPDTDGFISSIFLNKFFGWKVVGFYDGKQLVIDCDINFKKNKENYVFLDVEILRPNIKSIGHHILIYDNKDIHPLIDKIKNTCVQPNTWRGMDIKNSFAKKYPFGTFHLLISILYFINPKNSAFNFNPQKALGPSIYLDGVFKNLFNYPENCLDWLKYMSSDDLNHPFEKLLNHPTTPKDLMNLMKKFFDTLDTIWKTHGRRGKGKIKLNEDILNNQIKIQVAEELLEYLNYLAQQYNYKFQSDCWPVIKSKLISLKLKKDIASATKENYRKILNRKPISFAITSKARDGFEYTKANRIF